MIHIIRMTILAKTHSPPPDRHLYHLPLMCYTENGEAYSLILFSLRNYLDVDLVYLTALPMMLPRSCLIISSCHNNRCPSFINIGFQFCSMLRSVARIITFIKSLLFLRDRFTTSQCFFFSTLIFEDSLDPTPSSILKQDHFASQNNYLPATRFDKN